MSNRIRSNRTHDRLRAISLVLTARAARHVRGNMSCPAIHITYRISQQCGKYMVIRVVISNTSEHGTTYSYSI